MVVSVPMPEFKFEVLHVGDGFEVVTSKVPQESMVQPKGQSNTKTPETLKVVELRRALEVTNQGVNFMLVTGAGSIMKATQNEHGDFKIDRGILKMEEHMTREGLVEYFPSTIGFFTKNDDASKVVDKGFRQWGCAHLNPALLLEAAINNKTLEIAGYVYVPSENLEVSEVKVVCTPIESPEYLASARAWVNENKDTFAKMKSHTVNAAQVTHQLQTFARNRTQTTYNLMYSMYGNLNDPVNINEVGTWADTSTYMFKADPTQALAMVHAFNNSDDIKRKDALMLVRSAIQSAAEVCASYQVIGAHGEQTITTQQLIQFLRANTAPLVRSKLTAERKNVFRDVISTMHKVQTAINVPMHPYEPDENYQFAGKSIVAVENGAEKMNMAGEFPRIHLDEVQTKWLALKSDRDSLLSEQARLQRVAGEIPSAALATVNKKLADINALMMKLEYKVDKASEDCEDSSWKILMAMKVLENDANFLYEEVKPFVAKGFLPMENMFPSGQVDTMYKSENDKVEAIHFIVQASLQLTSEALKWQSKPVNGKRYSYESCFGLASAPSLQTQDPMDLQEKMSVTREQCTSFKNLLERKYKGQKLAGHCYTVRSETSLVKEFNNGVKVEIHKIGSEDMLEGTVGNAIFKESTEKMDERLGIKNVNISIGGRNINLQAAPHSKVRALIGDTITNKIKSADLGKQVWSNTPLNMNDGIRFYDLYSQIGGKQCVSAEITNSNNITSMMDPIATANALLTRASNVSFCTSTIAWDGCPTPSHQTNTVSIDVPLAPEEDRLIKQIAYELTPLHAMTKEHLAFIMNDMQRVVNVGFENGKFYGNDITGERLDSETRIAHFFVLTLTSNGQSQPKYWTNRKDINTVLQSEMQAALPGLAVRVSQIESGMHVMQVVVNS
jgi:hypothetical protein